MDSIPINSPSKAQNRKSPPLLPSGSEFMETVGKQPHLVSRLSTSPPIPDAFSLTNYREANQNEVTDYTKKNLQKFVVSIVEKCEVEPETMNIVKTVCQNFYEKHSKELNAIVEKALLPHKDMLMSLVGPTSSNQPLQLSFNSKESNTSSLGATQQKGFALVDEVIRTNNKNQDLTEEQYSKLSHIFEEVLNMLFKVAETISMKLSGTSAGSSSSPKITASPSPSSSPLLPPSPQFSEKTFEPETKKTRITKYSVFIVTTFLVCSTVLKFSRAASDVMEESVSAFMSKKQM